MEIHIFTDGACSNVNKPNASAGYGIHFPGEEFEDLGCPFRHAPITSQRAELYAIFKAITMTFAAVPPSYTLHIHTDSMYAVNVLTKWGAAWKAAGWPSTKKNLDLIVPLFETFTEHADRVTIQHVRAHTGGTDAASVGNAAADKLAVRGKLIHSAAIKALGVA